MAQRPAVRLDRMDKREPCPCGRGENYGACCGPLHDGAMIIRDGRICASGCFLPLSQNYTISKEMGTRHRAALGVSENSDAVVVVVSEETGVISYMFDGMLTRYLDIPTLRDILERIFIKTENADKRPPVFKFRRKVGEK